MLFVSFKHTVGSVGILNIKQFQICKISVKILEKLERRWFVTNKAIPSSFYVMLVQNRTYYSPPLVPCQEWLNSLLTLGPLYWGLVCHSTAAYVEVSAHAAMVATGKHHRVFLTSKGDRWQVTGDRWQLKLENWHMTYDKRQGRQVTGDRWQVTDDRWKMTCDRWQGTDDGWQVKNYRSQKSADQLSVTILYIYVYIYIYIYTLFLLFWH